MQNYIRERLYPVVLLALFLVGCSPSAEQIVIISTNDMHSNIDAFPRLATLVEEQRLAHPNNVILVDAGDRWTGNPYVDIAPEPYMPMIELINELGYDIATFGNHEWDSGEGVLGRRTDQATFAKVISNADLSSMPMHPVPRHIIVERGGLRIGFTGLITVEPESGHPVGKSESYGKTLFFEPLERAENMRWMRDSCDLYVAITHIGFDLDSLLATQRSEIDLILGGHSHTMIADGKLINKTLVTQTGHSLRYAGVTTIKHRKGRVVGIENRLVRLDEIEPSPRYVAMVERYKEEPELKRAVGSTVQRMGKIALMNLFSDIMRTGTESDFALYNMGGMRLDSIAAGEITRVDIYSAEPFRNSPVKHLMTLEQIKEMIINKFNGAGKESHTLDLYPSGMRYKIVTNSVGEATDIFFTHDAQPNNKGEYRVALSDYVSAAYNFAQRGKGVPTHFQITNLAEDYIKRDSPLEVSRYTRVEIE